MSGTSKNLKLFCSLVLVFAGQLQLHAADFEENSLETLFTTPSERRSINQARRGNSAANPNVSGGGVVVNGLVKRSDGKNTVWVNGKNNLESNRLGDVRVLNRNKGDKVGLRVDGRTVYMKPGEKWTEDTGKVEENY